jgi:hypothetical protein
VQQPQGIIAAINAVALTPLTNLFWCCVMVAGWYLNSWQAVPVGSNSSLILVDPQMQVNPAINPPQTATSTYIPTGYQNFAQADQYCMDAFGGRLASISNDAEWSAAHVSQSWLPYYGRDHANVHISFAAWAKLALQ